MGPGSGPSESPVSEEAGLCPWSGRDGRPGAWTVSTPGQGHGGLGKRRPFTSWPSSFEPPAAWCLAGGGPGGRRRRTRVRPGCVRPRLL